MKRDAFEIAPFALRGVRSRGGFDDYGVEAFEFESATSLPTLRLGSRGSAVADLQRRLAGAGVSAGAADGIFGSMTDAAVRAFQRARGLGVDGIVGAQTWGALVGAPRPAPSPAPAPTPAPPVGAPGDPRVTVSSGVLISANAVRVLKDILRAARLASATVTSGRRTSADQARIMFDLIERNGVAYAKNLYGSYGDQVIDAYSAAKAAGRSSIDVKAAMQSKVVQLGCQNVSHHCSDSYDVFDVAPSTIANSTAFRQALDAAVASGAIKMYLSPPDDPAFHIEIALASPSGELETWGEFESGPGSTTGRAGTARRPTVLAPLTIRVTPFVVLDNFAHKVPAMPAPHQPIVERIARLVVASRVARDPITEIRLVGHTDSTGPAAFNLGLGKQRAQSVETALRGAIAGLGTVPAGPLNIVVQTLGETRPVAPDTSAAGRARNRRVAVFLATTCHSFFAQYDLRFLPGDPVFGVPAHPNLSATQKAQRNADVGAMVPELLARRDRRAAAALLGRIPAPQPLAAGALRNSAVRLSAAQLALFREYFADGRGGIRFDAFQTCFERFANGQLRSPIAADQAKGVGEPNGGFFFLFAEFAFVCIESRIEPALWTQALRTFVKAQEIFIHVYRPAPVSPPPAVGARLPACLRDPHGGPRARRTLDSYSNANFRNTGASPIVGVGQSNPARRRALATKYALANLAALQRRAQENMRRAQCMP